MCKSNETLLKKRQFLERYNPDRSVENALSSSFDAALQRNKLYDFDTSVGRRKEIKNFCTIEMLRISEKYTEDISVDQYESDILELQLSMNERYRKYFNEDGFKISHAQKSLSVFLKILWANGKIKTPPLCPVDRTILVAAGERSPDAWTKVKTMSEFRRHIRILQQASRKHACGSLACWELNTFMQN